MKRLLLYLIPIISIILMIGCTSKKPTVYDYKLPPPPEFRAYEKSHISTLADGDVFLIEDVSDACATKYTTAEDIETFIYAASLTAALDVRCLESVFGTAIGTGLLLDGTTLKTSTILQKYHGVDPSVDVLAMLGSANDTALRTEIGLEIDTDVQSYEATLTDIADGTIAENLVNEDHPWEDNETSDDLSLDLLKLNVLTSAPGTPADGRIYLADNDNWDPCDIAGTDNYYCMYDGSDYVAILDEDGELLISSMELPSFSHFATGDATYSDNATPHVLTLSEVKGSVITNAGASEDKVYTCPAAAFGFNFMVMVIEAYQVDLEPDSGEALWLNGTIGAADAHIINIEDTKGDVMSCWSVESGDGTYEIFCESDSANFTLATP